MGWIGFEAAAIDHGGALGRGRCASGIKQRPRRCRVLATPNSVAVVELDCCVEALTASIRSLASRWSLDTLSVATLALVVVFLLVSPAPVAALWLVAELWFLLWYVRVRVPKLAKNRFSKGDASESSALLQHGLELFKRLLDPCEGALSVLQRSPHYVQSWFTGHEGQVGPGNVAELFDYLLLKGQARQLGEEAQNLLGQLATSFWAMMGLEEEEQQQQQPDVASAGSSTSTASSAGSVVGLGEQSAAFVPGSSFSHQLQSSALRGPGYYTEGAKPLDESMGLLMVCYRPLLFYVMMEGVAAWAHLSLTLRIGFTQAVSTQTATYYYRPGLAGYEADTPIVFLHGIGAGLAPYLPFLTKLAARTKRPLVAVQYKHVSMRMTHHVPSAQQVAADVRHVLTGHFGVDQVSLLAHSYGTLVAAALTKSSPDMVAGLTLLDPVCFALFLPHLLRASLLFHLPSVTAATSGMPAEAAAAVSSAAVLGSSVGSFGSLGLGSAGLLGSVPAPRWLPVGRWLSLRSMLKGVVVRDAHCAAALSRDAHWSELNLWPSDLPAHAPIRVVLSGNDHLVPVQEVVWLLSGACQYAAAANVAVRVHEGRGHGAFVLDPVLQMEIIESVLDGDSAMTAPGQPVAGVGAVQQQQQAELALMQQLVQPSVMPNPFMRASSSGLPLTPEVRGKRRRRVAPGFATVGRLRVPAAAAMRGGVRTVARQAQRLVRVAHAVLSWRVRAYR